MDRILNRKIYIVFNIFFIFMVKIKTLNTEEQSRFQLESSISMTDIWRSKMENKKLISNF
jgi:hypothetical protein